MSCRSKHAMVGYVYFVNNAYRSLHDVITFLREFHSVLYQIILNIFYVLLRVMPFSAE